MKGYAFAVPILIAIPLGIVFSVTQGSWWWFAIAIWVGAFISSLGAGDSDDEPWPPYPH